MRRIEGPIFIFIVVLLVGISVFWTNAIRHSEMDLAIKRLIEAGNSVDEILQDPDFTRLASEKDGLPTNPDEWTQDDSYRAMKRISESVKKLGDSSAVEQVRQDALQRRSAYLKKKIAVNEVIIAALKTHRKGAEPFTIENSLPASVRAEVEEAFGEDTESVLTQIEEAFATNDSSRRVLDSDGGIDGYVKQLLESLSAVPADE